MKASTRRKARLDCPRCGVSNYTIDGSGWRRARRHPEVNAVFRFARCRACGGNFPTVEVPLEGVIATAIEGAVGEW